MFGEKPSEFAVDEAETAMPEQSMTEEARRAAAEVKRKQLQADMAENSTGESNQD